MNTKKRTTIIHAILWLFIGTLVISGFTSCNRRLLPPISSTSSTVTIIDTVVEIRPDSTLFFALFECDRLNRVRLRELEQRKGATASQDVAFKDGALKIETRWKTQYIDRIKEVHDTTTVTIRQTIEVEKIVNRVPVFFWYCFGIAIVAILYLGFKIIRR